MEYFEVITNAATGEQTIRPYTSEEIAAVTAPPTTEEVRANRNKLLAASDWTQVADAPVDQAAWAAYRQALRDIPQQEGFPYSITWPVKPE